MERSNPVQSPAHANSLLLLALQRTGQAIRSWRNKRHAASVIGALSTNQLRDCGIATAELGKPSFEVPKGLMHKLMSMR